MARDMICESCGKLNDSGIKFCTRCGGAIEEREKGRGERKPREINSRMPHREEKHSHRQERAGRPGGDAPPESRPHKTPRTLKAQMDPDFTSNLLTAIGLLVFVAVIIFSIATADFDRISINLSIGAWVLGIAALAIAVGVYVIFRGVKQYRFRQSVRSVPTTPVSDISGGLVELQGVAQVCNAPLRTRHGGIPCVYYEYTVERLEVYYDKDDNRQERWTLIESGKSDQMFYLADATGSVLINPRQAVMTISNGQWNGGDGILRFLEKYIRPGGELYVMGTAQASGDSFIIASGPGEYRIADMSEEKLLGRLSWIIPLTILAGAGIITLTIFIFLRFLSTA